MYMDFGDFGLGPSWAPWNVSARFYSALGQKVVKPALEKGKEIVSNLPPVKAVREAKQAITETTATTAGIIGDIGQMFQNAARIAFYGGLLLLAWQLFKPTGIVGRELPYGRKHGKGH